MRGLMHRKLLSFHPRIAISGTTYRDSEQDEVALILNTRYTYHWFFVVDWYPYVLHSHFCFRILVTYISYIVPFRQGKEYELSTWCYTVPFRWHIPRLSFRPDNVTMPQQPLDFGLVHDPPKLPLLFGNKACSRLSGISTASHLPCWFIVFIYLSSCSCMSSHHTPSSHQRFLISINNILTTRPMLDFEPWIWRYDWVESNFLLGCVWDRINFECN